MFMGRLNFYHPSLRRWAGAFAVVWLIGTGVMAPVSITLLEQIHDDARLTYTKEIPALLDQDRDAIKLERLSSFLGSIGAARDAKVERHMFVQLQALAQSFDLENDIRLNGISVRAVSDARKVLALHATLRRLTGPPQATEGPDRGAQLVEVEQTARRMTEEGVQALNALADELTTGAALSADTLANRIQHNALRVERGCLAVLGFFFASGLLFLWIFQRHVLTPIKVAVHGLESIREADGTPVTLARARFSELDMIGRAIEQYARFAGDLRAANLALSTLSSQDGLTGLANRRSFDDALREACRRAETGARAFALLLIDIDHFKRLNDSFGHLVGDECLRQVAVTLQEVCARRGNLVSRYGGEEFAVILMETDPREACEVAERLRAAVERAQVSIEDARRAVTMTVSIGVASMTPGSASLPECLIEHADKALYMAKREGRNRIVTALPDGPLAHASQAAA